MVPPVSNTNTGLPAQPFGIQRCTGPPRSHSSSNAKARQIAEAANLAARIPAELAGEVQPERTAGRRIEMPGDDFANLGVERGARGVCRVVATSSSRASHASIASGTA